MTMTNGLDTAILKFFAALNTPEWLDLFILFWTNYAPRAFLLISVVFLLFHRTRKIGAISALAMILSFLLVEHFWKDLFARPRPYILFEWVKLIGPPAKSFSFPSGHSSIAFAFGVSLCFYNPKWIKAIVICCAFFTAFTRIYLSVHHLTDVMVGSIHGALCAVIAYFIINGFQMRFDPKNKYC